MELKKKFYGLTRDHREAYIHRHHLNDLLAFLKEQAIPDEKVSITYIDPPSPVSATFSVKPKFVLRDYQGPIVDALADSRASRRVDLQTGKGKTLCALYACMHIGSRLLVMVQPKYFGIWIEALEDIYQDIEGRYVTISGSAELQMMIDRMLDGDFQYDVVILSAMTYRAFIEAFEYHRDQLADETNYNVPPPRFHEAMGFGVQINDEFQDDPGLVFRTDIYTNVRKQIYLSATPYTGNDYVTRMIDVMTPEETYVPLPSWDCYINVIALLYADREVDKKDYTAPFKGTYNHARYEKQMLKKKRRTEAYFRMVKKAVQGLFVNDREKGQRMLILCSTVDFIKTLTKYLNVQFPTLTIGSHVAGSDYNRLLSNDITVSTIKSSGTGVDIPDLREVLMLQATNSKKDNIQTLGRLRHMKSFPDVTPRFTYLVCENIKKHTQYHQSKREYFSGRVLSHKVMRIN